MNPDFSERQYEAAINQEVCLELGSLLTHPLPRIPTTNEESKLGWDAKFEVGSYWYFLQYKTAVHASRSTGWNSHIWAAHNRDYFRFDLLSNSNGYCHQHQLLSELRERQPGVYYCCPLFVRQDDFWKYADNREVFWRSALIDVASVPLPNPWGRHQISYDSDGYAQSWSEPNEGSVTNRAPSIRADPANLRRVSQVTVANLIADAAEIWSETNPNRDISAFSLVIHRLRPEIRRTVGQELEQKDGQKLRQRLVELLDLQDLIATAGRILVLDFELAFFIEPVDSHTPIER